MQLLANPAMSDMAVRFFLLDAGFDLERPLSSMEDPETQDWIYTQDLPDEAAWPTQKLKSQT